MQRGGYYVSTAGRVHPAAHVGQFSVILGQVAEGACVTKSFVGEASIVGKNVCLDEVTLGKNVTIEDGCKLSKCFVANDCVVFKGEKPTDRIISLSLSLSLSCCTSLLRFE